MDADFYIGLGPDAVWIGSIEGAGSPAAVAAHDLFNDHEGGSREEYDETDFRRVVTDIIDAQKASSDAVNFGWSSDDGWPWKYADSGDTDYAYAWNNGCIHVFENGFLIAQHYPNGARRQSEFPTMRGH